MGSNPSGCDIFSYYEFFLSHSFLPVESAKRVYTVGKEVADTHPAIKISVSTAEGGSGGLRERNLLCDHGSDVLTRCPGWQGVLRTLDICEDKKNTATRDEFISSPASCLCCNRCVGLGYFCLAGANPARNIPAILGYPR